MNARILRVRPEAVHFREIENEIVAVDVAGGEYFTVNRAGTELWPVLLEGTTVERMAARLDQRFGLGAERAQADAAAFVEALDARGLLEP